MFFNHLTIHNQIFVDTDCRSTKPVLFSKYFLQGFMLWLSHLYLTHNFVFYPYRVLGTFQGLVLQISALIKCSLRLQTAPMNLQFLLV